MNEHFPSAVGQHAVSSEMAGQSPPYDPATPLHHSSTLTLEGHANAYKEQLQSEVATTPEPEPPLPQPESNQEYYDYSWQVPGVSEEVQNFVYDQFTNLVTAEQQPALPEDVVRIPRATDPESVEASIMRAAGFDEEKIRSVEFTREDLQAAGFFFVNRLGGGEKGIIHAAIPDSDSPEGVLDLTNRTLLTKAELDKVYDYQIKSEGGLQGIPVDQVRADALTFLLAAQTPALFRGSADMAEKCLPMSVEDEGWQVGSQDERQAVLDFLADFRQKYEEMLQLPSDKAMEYVRKDLLITDLISKGTNFSREKLYQTSGWTAAGAATTTRTGAQAFSIYERRDKLRGVHSPFLDSGFRFDANPDILVEIPGREPALKRLNMVNIHLMGGHPEYLGLSEMGQADWDQGYISTSDFLKNFAAVITNMGEEEAWRQDLQMIDRETTQREVIKQTQINLINHVKTLRK